VVQLISDSVSWLNNLLHSLLSCKYTYTFISCPVGILVCHKTTEYQGRTALAALSSRRPNNRTAGVALPILDNILYHPGPRTQDLGPRKQPYATPFDTRTPAQLTKSTSLAHSNIQTPRDPKHHPTKKPNPSTLYLFAHLRHPESTIATAPPILTHCDKSQSLSGPKLPLRTRSQDARFPRGVLGLVRRCAVCCFQQIVRIESSSACTSNRAAETNIATHTVYPDVWLSDL
jgi:hypothetical protein